MIINSMNNYSEFEQKIKEKCLKHSAWVPCKNPNVYKLDDGEEEIVIIFQDDKLIFKYRAHEPMLQSELAEFWSLARLWQDHYSFKKYCLSILVGKEDWYFDEKKTRIFGLINGMNIK